MHYYSYLIYLFIISIVLLLAKLIYNYGYYNGLSRLQQEIKALDKFYRTEMEYYLNSIKEQLELDK